ncbi:MAG TPA: biotin--[acetyl-CoA-carboxylase] ligase, partial [Myxococcota bacterium]|nr:biotin--[acetyl-CoA-carboxylase] ligase [Myxococcota bacterium]
MNKYALDPDLHYELKQAIEGLTYLTNAMAFRSVGSTNDYALLLEKDHLLGGTIIMAAEQTSGRGRLGRTWHMQKGDIAMSLLLRAPNLPRNQALLPMMPALSIVRSLGALAIPVRLKWPNDVIVPKVS